MRFNVARRLWVALAILPLIGGIALASGSVTFVCRGDMVARTTCCCPESGHAASAPGGAELAVLVAGCCCDVSQMKAPVTPAVAESRAPSQITRHLDVVPAVPQVLVLWSSGFHARSAARLAHPPPQAVPILLSKQSFLI